MDSQDTERGRNYWQSFHRNYPHKTGGSSDKWRKVVRSGSGIATGSGECHHGGEEEEILEDNSQSIKA